MLPIYLISRCHVFYSSEKAVSVVSFRSNPRGEAAPDFIVVGEQVVKHCGHGASRIPVFTQRQGKRNGQGLASLRVRQEEKN
jgi:hypothetical protein